MDEQENELIDETRYTEETGGDQGFSFKSIDSVESPFASLRGTTHKTNYSPDNLTLRLTFMEKLAKWTNNFTIEPMDIEVLRANGSRAIPEFSGIEEFDKYQEIRSVFSNYLSRFNKDAREIWEIVKQEHPELFV